MVPTLVHAQIADALWHAELTRTPCDAPSVAHPGLSLEDAYAVQALVLKHRRELHRQVGWKVGVTSAPVQKWLNIDHPDFGGLFSDMQVLDGGVARLDRLIAPKAEGEIAFVLKKLLKGPGLGHAEAIAAIDFILPAIEIIDSRVRDWKIKAVDTIADNGSSAMFVLGCRPISLAQIDMKLIGVAMRANGEVVSTGAGAACMGNPINALVWLANELGRQGRCIEAGQVVLSGALSEVYAPHAGDHVEVVLGSVGRVEVRFA
jgi:2-oxopent-4-enoate/cis-2-oxohex-4-enoate hydratase